MRTINKFDSLTRSDHTVMLCCDLGNQNNSYLSIGFQYQVIIFSQHSINNTCIMFSLVLLQKLYNLTSIVFILRFI